MSGWDWGIVVGVFTALGFVACYSNKYLSGVAGFLVGDRCARRYLLVGAEMMALTSAALFVARSEQYYKGGFPFIWWGMCLILITVVRSLSGWVVYRFRETRALTMAQFFEIRYDKKFRVFMGGLAWVSGVINYAIHPAITSRLLVHFCGLPQTVEVAGFEIRTIFIVMLVMLSVATFLTLSGGQISLMITDFFQGQLLLFVSLAVVFFLFWRFNWTEVSQVLLAAPEGESVINPFKQARVQDFNIWFFVIIIFISFYQEMGFQGNQGYFGAAKNPHEAKMSKIIAMWRDVPLVLLYITSAISGYVILNGAGVFGEDNAAITTILSNIPQKWEQSQMQIPLVLSYLLPVGLTGLLAAVFIASSISTDDTYLHAWGSILVQDVIIPLRKKHLSPERHLRLLRISVVAVAVIVFVLGSLIPFRDYVYMYFYITYAIYGAGAGAAIIGGLYWKRGTTAGAWTSIITGATLCSAGFLLRTIWPHIEILSNYSEECPLNGLQMTFFASGISLILYVSVSLLWKKNPCNMDKLLNRGQYAIEGEHQVIKQKKTFIQKITGIGSEFTVRDKFFAYIAIAWTVFWSVLVWGGSVYCLVVGVSDQAWLKFWYCFLVIYFVISVIVAVWYFIGGIYDVADLFRTLKSKAVNPDDDGTVGSDFKGGDKV